MDAGGAIEITAGRVLVDTTQFVGNTAGVGGAMKIFGTAELFNSTFFDKTSGEDDGPAIFNVGTNPEMTGLEFTGNRFVCATTEYVDFSKASGKSLIQKTLCLDVIVVCSVLAQEDGLFELGHLYDCTL